VNVHLFSVTYADSDSSIPDSPIPLHQQCGLLGIREKTGTPQSSSDARQGGSTETEEEEEPLQQQPGEFPARRRPPLPVSPMAIRNSESAVQNRFFNSPTEAACRPPTSAHSYWNGWLDVIPLTCESRQPGVFALFRMADTQSASIYCRFQCC